jgi:tetratricopeptide (TPR) repeat protein
VFSCSNGKKLVSAVRPIEVSHVRRGAVPWGLCQALALAVLASGCSELQARRHARAGNAHYLEGDYAGAVREYEVADDTHPGLFVVALNKGLACRQMMTAGSHSPEQTRAVDCAIAAFKKMKELRPQDPRGDQLYVQTLFDGERYDTLIALYEAQLKADPKNLAAINGLISVHSRADHWTEALRWTAKRADVDSTDAEAQYAVGAMIFNRLFQKGGSDKGSFDPHPDDSNPKHPIFPTPPPFTVGDVLGAERVKLADFGLAYLQKALQLRPAYPEAMIFSGLLYRQKSLAYLENPDSWDVCIKAAEEWRLKAQQLVNPSAAPAPGTTAPNNAGPGSAAPAGGAAPAPTAPTPS